MRRDVGGSLSNVERTFLEEKSQKLHHTSQMAGMSPA
jgi:hypothetical protein